MKKIDLGQTINTLANIGVIAGIVFLAIQLKQVNVQLDQDRSVAAADRLTEGSSGRKYWAELVTANSELWYRGATGMGEPLSDEEALAFQALVAAWDNESWLRWYITAKLSDVSTPESAATWINDAAHYLHEFPGLLRYWRREQQRFSMSSDDSEWPELVEAELRRIAADEN